MKKLFTALSIIFFLSPLSALALNFDGVDDYVSASLNLSGTNKITVSFWLNWDTNANDDQLAMEFTSVISNAGSFLVNPNDSSTGKVVITVGGNVPSYNQQSFARPSARVWHHWAILMDRSSSGNEIPNVYIDGVNQSLTTVVSGNHTDNFANSTLYWMSRNGSSLFGKGRMDEVRVYNRALSATEVRMLYYGFGSRNGLIGYWPLIGNTSGTFEPDFSGYRNHGTRTSGPIRAALHPFTRLMKFR